MRYVLFVGGPTPCLVADHPECLLEAELDDEPVCVFEAATGAEAGQLLNDVMGYGEFDMVDEAGGNAELWNVRRFLMLEAIDDQLSREGFGDPYGPLLINIGIAISRLWDEMPQVDRDEVIKLAVVERIEQLKKRL